MLLLKLQFFYNNYMNLMQNLFIFNYKFKFIFFYYYQYFKK